jgi:hypothetical protein
MKNFFAVLFLIAAAAFSTFVWGAGNDQPVQQTAELKPGDPVEAKLTDIGCPTETMIRDLDRFMKENNVPATKNLVHPGACQTYEMGTVGTIKDSSGTYVCFLPSGKSTCIWADRENLKPK